MENFYKNSFEKIKCFYTAKIDETNIESKVFEFLKNIIPFDCGRIFYSNGDEKKPVYSFNPDKSTIYYIEEPLYANNLPFGSIQIGRDAEFKDDELSVFKTCSFVIANLIKDIEMNAIVKMQLNMLQDGIKEKNSENKKILEEEQAKNTFIANVSHELRSPLNSIMGFTELLHTQFIGSLNKKQLEYIDDIRIASLHLLNMVNEILDISKIESGTMKLNLTEFDFLMNVNEVLNILKPLYIKKKINMINEISENIQITADYQKLQQILFNLISNAIKFTPHNGIIQISAMQSKNYFTICIKDNGCGIPKKFHKRIFNKFEQITETSNSTGLGLTITKELVNLHKGKISLNSEPNMGSEFIIKIPIS